MNWEIEKNFDSCNNLLFHCDCALEPFRQHWHTEYWCFEFARNAFYSTIFLIINFYPRNERNLDAHNNLISFYYFILQSCFPYLDTRYWCFILAREVFLSTIFLIIKVHSWNETNFDTHNNSILFVIGTAIMFSSLGYTILMLWICRKSFSFHYFPYNQS